MANRHPQIYFIYLFNSTSYMVLSNDTSKKTQINIKTGIQNVVYPIVEDKLLAS